MKNSSFEIVKLYIYIYVHVLAGPGGPTTACTRG